MLTVARSDKPDLPQLRCLYSDLNREHRTIAVSTWLKSQTRPQKTGGQCSSMQNKKASVKHETTVRQPSNTKTTVTATLTSQTGGIYDGDVVLIFA